VVVDRIRLRAPGRGYCSGSSLMPQKRNPDIAELLRAKSARLLGDVVALLTVSKGLPLAYNKDLQESQEPFYDAIETTRLSLAVLPGLLTGLEFNAERMKETARDAALGATDLAEHLVREGVPFRRAHEDRGPSGPPGRASGCRAQRRSRNGTDWHRARIASRLPADPESQSGRRSPHRDRRSRAQPGHARSGAPGGGTARLGLRGVVPKADRKW